MTVVAERDVIGQTLVDAKERGDHSTEDARFTGHVCCECAPRLREQNKRSSDKWVARTQKMASDLDGLRHLMAEALTLHRGMDGDPHAGISQYGQAALAAALRIADEAEATIEALRKQVGTERQARRAAESRLRDAVRHIWQRETRINDLELEIARLESASSVDVEVDQVTTEAAPSAAHSCSAPNDVARATDERAVWPVGDDG